MSDVMQIGISADASELTATAIQSRNEVRATESAFQKFGESVVASMQFAGDVTSAVLQEMGRELRVVTDGALSSFGQVMGAAAGHAIVYRSAISVATSHLGSFWSAMRVGLSAGSWFVPWLKVATIGLAAASVATFVYRSANEELVAELNKAIVPTEKTSKAWGELENAGAQASTTLRTVGRDVADVGVAWATVIAQGSGISAVAGAVDSFAGGAVQAVADDIGMLSTGVQILSDVTMDWADSGTMSAAALRAQTAASEKLIAKQQAQSVLFGQLSAMQEVAANNAQHSGELQRLASLGTTEAIDAEIKALQQKATAAILAGDATAEGQKKTAELFAALENQRGKVAANDKQAALEAELAATKAITDAKKEQQRLEDSAADRVANLKDQLDLLTGAATKGDIVMREMMRDGFTAEQANEIAGLTDELGKLQESQKEPDEPSKVAAVAKADRTMLKSAFAGSQDAASIMLRGVGPGKDQAAEKQLNVSQQILAATKENKPQPLTPLTLGT